VAQKKNSSQKNSSVFIFSFGGRSVKNEVCNAFASVLILQGMGGPHTHFKINFSGSGGSIKARYFITAVNCAELQF
jgi:hypothetical protein